MRDYVFDSFAIIAFFEDEPGADEVERVLRELYTKRARGWMSVINWGEVYYSTYREQGQEAAEMVIRQLAKYPIEVVDADRDLTREAARLKGRYRIAYADCFAIALAKRKGAELLTGDPEFRKAKGEVRIYWIGEKGD